MASSLSLDLLEADTEYWSATRSRWVKSIPSVPATILPPLEAILVISEIMNMISSNMNHNFINHNSNLDDDVESETQTPFTNIFCM